MKSNGKAISHVVETYTQALFDIAVESQLTSVIDADLDMVGKLFADEKDLRELMGSPYFTSKQKADLLEKVFSEKIEVLTVNFLMVLVRHNRIKFLPAIMDCYDRLWQNYKGYVQVIVTIPQVMDNDWICNLENDLESALGQKISLKLSIDPSVIGGVVIHYGNKVVDNTIRTKLLGTVKAVTSAEKLWMKTNEV